MKAAFLALAAVAALAFSFPAAEAIVSVQQAEHHFAEYPYNLLVVFFTLVCSALLVTLVVHFYRAQWGRKSIITE
jgi:hypothetical protein